MTSKKGRAAQEIKETAARVDEILGSLFKRGSVAYPAKPADASVPTAPQAPAAQPASSSAETVTKEIPAVEAPPSYEPLKKLQKLASVIFKKVPELDLITVGTQFSMYDDEDWESSGNFITYYGKTPPAGSKKSRVQIDAVKPPDHDYGDWTPKREPDPDYDALQAKLDKVAEVRQLERTISTIIPSDAVDDDQVKRPIDPTYPNRVRPGKSESNITAWRPAYGSGLDYPAYLSIDVNRKFMLVHLLDMDGVWEVWEKFDLNFNPIDRGATWPSDEKCAKAIAEYLGLDVEIGNYKTLPNTVRIFR